MYNSVKGTSLRSGRVTHLKYTLFEKLFILLSTCIGHSILFCGTSLCLLSVGSSFKTYIISDDTGKTLVTLFAVQQINSDVKPNCQIDRGHIRVPQNLV